MNKNRRRGAILVEALVATALLGTALTITAQLSGLARAQQRSAERRAVAIAEAANLMERAAALPADKVTAEAAAEWKLSSTAVEALPEARLAVEVRDEPGGLPSRRLSIEIRWRQRAGNDEAPVRLTTWVYPMAKPPTEETTALEEATP